MSVDILRRQSHTSLVEQKMIYVTIEDTTIENVRKKLNMLAFDDGLDRFYRAGLALSLVQYIEYRSDSETNGRVE